MNQRCFTCRFCVRLRETYSSGIHAYECHRHPGKRNWFTGYAVWPRVNKTDFCGEWKEEDPENDDQSDKKGA